MPDAIVDFSQLPGGWMLWHMTGPQEPAPNGNSWLVELHRISDRRKVRAGGTTPHDAYAAALEHARGDDDAAS